MSDRHQTLVRLYRTAYDDLIAEHWRLQDENRRLRQANAILALPRMTDEQLKATEAALAFLVFGDSHERTIN